MFKVYLGILVAVAVSLGYLYVNNLQNKLEIALVNNAKLVTVAAVNQETIATLQQDIVQQAKMVEDLNSSLEAATESKTVLLQKLQKHDLAKLAAAKPKLIESRINAATAKVFNELESITAN